MFLFVSLELFQFDLLPLFVSYVISSFLVPYVVQT